jgi:hypothetical protein
MSTSTLEIIKKKVRRLTGTPSTSQLSDSDLNEYIDTFYEQDLPSSLKLWNLKSNYTFFTTPNEDRYTFPVNTYHSLGKPIYIAGYETFYTQDQTEFYRIYPKNNFVETAATGDGATSAFSFTLSNTPVLKRQVTITAVDTSGNPQTAEDDGDGNLVTPGTSTSLGTINYTTGAVSVTFAQPIANEEKVSAEYVRYTASQPTALLFFNQYIFLRPVPDKTYRVEVQVYQKPSQLLSANNNDPTNTPDINQWWQLIAFGAARKVLQDRLDNEALASIEPFYQEQMNLVMYRTATQLANQRVSTIYTEQIQPNGINNGYFGYP